MRFICFTIAPVTHDQKDTSFLNQTLVKVEPAPDESVEIFRDKFFFAKRRSRSMHTSIEEKDLSLPFLNIKQARQSAWIETHNRAIRCARQLKTAYGELLAVLIEVERDQIYAQFEIVSLYRYCVDILQLPKHTSYDFIDIVRTSKTVPALAKAVIDGRTSVTKARRVCSVINEKNQDEWISLISECTQDVVQKCVAMANPRLAVKESLKYVASDTLEIKFAVSEEWAELLKETKDLLSTRERRAVTTEEALFILMAENKKRNDPVRKAERALFRKQTKSAAKWQSDRAPSRQVPKDVEHEVTLRDQNQCTYVDRNGQRCSSKRWLEKHHIVEFAKGGAHTVENLETLCAAHQRMKHRAAQRH